MICLKKAKKVISIVMRARAHDPNTGKYPCIKAGLFGLAKSNKKSTAMQITTGNCIKLRVPVSGDFSCIPGIPARPPRGAHDFARRPSKFGEIHLPLRHCISKRTKRRPRQTKPKEHELHKHEFEF